MALLILPRHSLQKPSPSAQLNRSHFLAQGLKHYWPILEQSPYLWPDYVTGKVGTPSGAFGFGHNPTGYGAGGPVVDIRDGLAFNTALPFAHDMTGATAFTIAALVYIGPAVAGSTAGSILLDSVSGGGGGLEAGCRIATDGAGGTPFVRIAVGPGYTAYCDIPSASIPTLQFVSLFFTGLSGSPLNTLIGRWPTGRVEDYNAVATGGRTGTWSLPSTSWNMWGLNASGTQPANAYAWTGVWDRRLDLAEMQALHENPWQMLLPSRLRTTYAIPGTDPTPTTVSNYIPCYRPRRR